MLSFFNIAPNRMMTTFHKTPCARKFGTRVPEGLAQDEKCTISLSVHVLQKQFQVTPRAQGLHKLRASAPQGHSGTRNIGPPPHVTPINPCKPLQKPYNKAYTAPIYPWDTTCHRAGMGGKVDTIPLPGDELSFALGKAWWGK